MGMMLFAFLSMSTDTGIKLCKKDKLGVSMQNIKRHPNDIRWHGVL